MTTPAIQPSWEGVPLTVVRLRDQFGRRWVEHGYPGRRGVEMEDLGGLPARLDVQVVFFGPTWREDLDAFWAKVEVPLADGVGIFAHPWWGNFVGVIPSIEITFEDRRREMALVRFTFVEADTTPLGFNAELTLTSAIQEAEATIARISAALDELEAR